MPTPERRRELADRAVRRRAYLGRLNTCINGPMHGPATHGRRCAWCAMVHSRGLAATIALEAEGKAPPRPPGYEPKPLHGSASERLAARNASRKKRERTLAESRLCIRARSHGRATNGQLCAWCALVNSRGLAAVLKLEADGLAPRRPPKYKPRLPGAAPAPAPEIDDDDDGWLR